jgi:hypothetical protein
MLTAVMVAPLEQAELATAAPLGACAQEFPYAVPRPATRPRGETSRRAYK